MGDRNEAPSPSQRSPLNRRRSDSFDDGATIILSALAVDDDPSFRSFIAYLLQKLGFSVTLAASGPEALELIREREFDILVLDLAMPEMNGFEVLSQVRRDQHSNNLYAILLTARDDTETKLSALNGGFDDFISKAAGEEEISAKLRSAKRLLRTHRSLRRQNLALYELAITDPLTRLSNRRFFFSQAEDFLASSPKLLSLALFDLDNFKTINDQSGHLVGDRILADVAAVFRDNTRTMDLVARYGGDEFVMLIPNTPPEEVEKIAQRIAEKVALLEWDTDRGPVRTSISTGIASVSEFDAPSLMQLLATCDKRLYDRKRSRNGGSSDAPPRQQTAPDERSAAEKKPKSDPGDRLASHPVPHR